MATKPAKKAPIAKKPDGNWRTSDQTSTQRGYGYRWQQARLAFLREHSLCLMCEAEGRVEVATVVDHKIPHRGDQKLFWHRSNWQPLCTTHHSRDKQREELGTQSPAIGVDGWPVEHSHPGG
ncbi:HNH endonuclease [Comamonas sp.]|uniref:HNH endonuclease n=1 Tax=Comamonas sp. TaxID=34028 RepID=UPI002590387D|nr:HNH endonuclease signature motif containing protein [Comamonas sp.]